MKPEEIQKLLGGYATGTLTPEEQQALFETALKDQELFDALAREQTLRDLLRDPAARAHVLASIEERPRPWWRRGNRWVLAGATLAACLAAAAGIFWSRSKPAQRPVLVAELKQPAASTPIAIQPATELNVPAPPRGPVVKRKTLPRAAVRRLAPSAFLARQPQTQGAPPSPTPAPAAAPARPPLATESVTVTAASSALVVNGSTSAGLDTNALPTNARALFYGQPFVPLQNGALESQQAAPMTRQAAAQLQAQVFKDFVARNLGVKWTALRKQPGGLFSEVDPDQIKAGDVIKLRLVPNDDGYLSVREGTRSVVAERRVTRLQPFETPELTGASGKKELLVVLARQPQTSPQLEKAPDAKQQSPAAVFRPVADTGQLSQRDQREHAVYEVATGVNLLSPVLVRITLNFQ